MFDLFDNLPDITRRIMVYLEMYTCNMYIGLLIVFYLFFNRFQKRFWKRPTRFELLENE